MTMVRYSPARLSDSELDGILFAAAVNHDESPSMALALETVLSYETERRASQNPEAVEVMPLVLDCNVLDGRELRNAWAMVAFMKMAFDANAAAFLGAVKDVLESEIETRAAAEKAKEK